MGAERSTRVLQAPRCSLDSEEAGRCDSTVGEIVVRPHSRLCNSAETAENPSGQRSWPNLFLGRCSVSQGEAEQVFFNEPLLLLPDRKRSDEEQRFHALGKTQDGRLVEEGVVFCLLCINL